MENKENKFDKYKQLIIDIYSDETVIDKLKINQELNRNFQFQIHLLLMLNDNDNDLKTIINDLKTNNILIHFFNETYSNEEIENLLESNNLKINKNLDIPPELTILDLISKNKDLDFKAKQDLTQDYIEAFKNSKKKKWFKKIKSKAVVIAMFLALFTKTRDKKFKLLLQETIDNLNNDYQLNINRDYPDEAFIKVFYEYIINASVKKSLIIVLISLVVIFIAVLTMILVIT